MLPGLNVVLHDEVISVSWSVISNFKHTYLAQEIPWSTWGFSREETLTLYYVRVDSCDRLKCGWLECVIFVSGDCVRAIPKIVKKNDYMFMIIFFQNIISYFQFCSSGLRKYLKINQSKILCYFIVQYQLLLFWNTVSVISLYSRRIFGLYPLRLTVPVGIPFLYLVFEAEAFKHSWIRVWSIFFIYCLAMGKKE